MGPSNVEDVSASTTIAELQNIMEQDIVIVPENKSSSSSTASIWKPEDCDAPKSEFGLDFVTLPPFLLVPCS